MTISGGVLDLAGVRVGVQEPGTSASTSGRTFQDVDFRLEIVAWEGLPVDPAVRLPVEVRGSGDRVSYRSPDSELVLSEGGERGRLRMSARSDQAVRRAVRIGVACALARRGGFLLHAAGVAGPRGALLFFGPSGAGKSTISSTSPFPVLGDELVAVRTRETCSAARAGFDGDRFEAGPVEGHHIAGVFELGKGDRTRVSELDPGEAVRKLLGCAVIPPVAAAWKPGLEAVSRLAASVPVRRLEWRLGFPPWSELRVLGYL